MRCVILGGGVIGVTTAYYLARDGHEVVVLEAAPELATLASGGNAGLIAPGHSFAWASPAAPRQLIASLRGAQTAIRVKPRLDPKLMAWGLQFLRECTTTRAQANTLVKLQLSLHSQRLLEEITTEEKIDFSHVTAGLVYLYRKEADLDAGVAKMQFMKDQGIALEVLDGPGLVAVDPAFKSASDSFAGAIRVPSDGSGNSAQFTVGLAERCRRLGVEFRLGVRAQRFTADADRVTGVQTDHGLVTGESYVLAMGVDSPRLSRTVGQRLPIYPAKGYSLTADILDESATPRIGGVDEGTLVAWSRFGSELRMSSTAEFAGPSRDWKYSDFQNILNTGKEIFPGAVDWDRARLRSCLRPMTPDGPPIVGLGKHRNLYYNTGHGHMGWTMACGTSRAVADLIGNRAPRVNIAGMEVKAWRAH